MDDYIFLSYSHKDKNYVDKLAEWLENSGFHVWLDARIDYGARWPHVIQQQLDESSACIVVVSQNSFESEWVQHEITRAQRKGKRIFPLLLGGEPWLSIESIQYIDVTHRELPPPHFLSQLSQYVQPQTVVEDLEPKKTIINERYRRRGLPQTLSSAAISGPQVNRDKVYLGLAWGLLAIFLSVAIYLYPLWATAISLKSVSAATYIWIVIFFVLPLFWYFRTRKHSGKQGLYAVLVLLTAFLLGWLYRNWFGIMFISLPLLLIFFYAVVSLAQVIIPGAKPETLKERWQKTELFLAYVFGVQYPIWIAPKTGRQFEMRTPRDYADGTGNPGIVWTWSHQIASLSKNNRFDEIVEPGITFTNQFETPTTVIDLRTQLRVAVVDAITKDGMNVPAVIFTAFAIDREKWPKEEWSRAFSSKMRHFFPDSLELDHPQGSYPYSSGRVRSVLSTAGINTSLEDGEKPDFHWDEWVVKQIEQAAREILAERSLDELWRPKSDGPGISALDEMAQALKKLVAPRLAEVGVNLFTARIINYEFDQESHVAKQNIRTWSTYWEEQITKAHAEAESIYREEIEKAYADSKSVLLDVVTDNIKKARSIREDLPRHLIAHYYVHALEQYIKKQPGLDIDESKKRLEDVKNFLLYNQTEETE